MLFFWRFVEFLGSDNESSNQVMFMLSCFVLLGSKACPTQAPLSWPGSVHINQQVVPEALALVPLLISVSARVKVYEFYPGATQREAGRPSDSSHNGWPLICLQRRATARDEGSRKFSVHA